MHLEASKFKAGLELEVGVACGLSLVVGSHVEAVSGHAPRCWPSSAGRQVTDTRNAATDESSVALLSCRTRAALSVAAGWAERRVFNRVGHV